MINTTILISVIAAVVLILLIALIAIGLKRKKDKTVSFSTEDEPKELDQRQKSGDYVAQGGFNFTQASHGDKEPVLRTQPKKPEPAPSAFEIPDTPASTPAPAPAPVPTPAPAQTPSTADTIPTPVTGPEPVEAEIIEPDASPSHDASPVNAPSPTETPSATDTSSTDDEPEELLVDATEPVDEPIDQPAGALETEPETSEFASEPAETVVSKPAMQPTGPAAAPTLVEETAPVQHQATTIDTDTPAPAPEAPEAPELRETSTLAEAREVSAAPVPPVAPETSVAPEAPSALAAPRDDIAPAEGRLGRLRGRLARSNNVIGQGVLGILTAGDLDEDAWEEIEDTLIMADLGSTTTMKVVDSLRDKIARRGVSSEDEARTMLRDTLIEACKPELNRAVSAMPIESKPAVVLMVGVNGTGKTTTTGKLARVLVAMGHSVVLGAADTFRAAAADQLQTWGDRVGAVTVRGKEGADPASVAFDAVSKGIESGADVVVLDTAGRLHTSQGLMDQLGKVKRVVEKRTHVDEVLLVLDATVGQNGLLQARTFRDVVDITGVVLTKLDGSAKGGIVFQVQEELGVPVKLVGLGEGADDLAPFEPESFVDALLR